MRVVFSCLRNCSDCMREDFRNKGRGFQHVDPETAKALEPNVTVLLREKFMSWEYNDSHWRRYCWWAGILIFVGPKEPGLQTATPSPNFRLRLQDVMCDIVSVYFRMNGEKIWILLTKGAHQCTIVYKQNFHCNWIWAKVSYRLQKEQKSNWPLNYTKKLPGVGVPLKRKTWTPTATPGQNLDSGRLRVQLRLHTPVDECGRLSQRPDSF